MDTSAVRVLLATTGAWWLPKTAKAFDARNALAEFWCADKNSTNIPADKYRRCWPYHLMMKPFYHLGRRYYWEKVFYAASPIWERWVRRQPLPECNVVHAMMGFGSELFDRAEKVGALKVADCPNTHPTSYYGFWQRECDLWCPGAKVVVSRRTFARMNRELERADMIIVQSTFAKESMLYNGIPGNRVFINPMGVDPTVFQKRTTLPDHPRFISVGGAITLRKGFQYLFRAFQLVKKELPNAELICVGVYKYDFCKERPKWEGTFTHYSCLPHAEIASLLQTSTAFVFPSQEEGIARAQIEALASGLPVIGTHAGGTTTLVENGVEGFIVGGRDPAELAQAMIRLAKDPQLNMRMGQAAYRKGAAANTWQDYGDRLLAEYARRLADHRPVRGLGS
jgi:glycosyltransferase involved in cell wall biosynthesis